MGFKTHVHTTRTNVSSNSAFTSYYWTGAPVFFFFLTGHFPPLFVNVTHFFFENKNYNSKVRNIVSQRFLYTTVRKKSVTSFCSIVHRPIVYGMHISMVDSVHILLRRRLQQNRACRSRGGARLGPA